MTGLRHNRDARWEIDMLSNSLNDRPFDREDASKPLISDRGKVGSNRRADGRQHDDRAETLARASGDSGSRHKYERRKPPALSGMYA